MPTFNVPANLPNGGAVTGGLTQSQADARYAQQLPTKGSYRVKTEGDGTTNIQLWNPTTSLWHTLFATGASGAVQLQVGVGES